MNTWFGWDNKYLVIKKKIFYVSLPNFTCLNKSLVETIKLLRKQHKFDEDDKNQSKELFCCPNQVLIVSVKTCLKHIT